MRAPASGGKRARDQVERRIVLRVTPAPVAVKVRVVGRQALSRRNARTQRQMRFQRRYRSHPGSAAPAAVPARLMRALRANETLEARARQRMQVGRLQRTMRCARRRLPIGAAAGAFVYAIRPGLRPVRRTATARRRDPENRRDSARSASGLRRLARRRAPCRSVGTRAGRRSVCGGGESSDNPGRSSICAILQLRSRQDTAVRPAPPDVIVRSRASGDRAVHDRLERRQRIQHRWRQARAGEQRARNCPVHHAAPCS